MPTDVQAHDFTWGLITTLGLLGYIYMWLMLGTLWGILWQINCMLRERVLLMRNQRENWSKK